MQPKYRLTDETKTLLDGTVLHRIEALREGPWGPVGTLGGWVQHEQNLSHEGNCWVSGNARVSGTAQVSGNAWVSGNARVFENAKVFGTARVFRNAKIFGNQKVNGCCWVNGDEKDQEFQVHDVCICDSEKPYFKKYHGCFWIVSATYPGWVQAKHGDEEIAFRNEWLRKL